MNPLTQVPGQAPGKFRVGDRVRILHGFRGVIGEVVEDRGPIGVRGRRLYGVRFRLDEWNEDTTELPEESLEPVETGPDERPGKGPPATPADAGSPHSGGAEKEP